MNVALICCVACAIAAAMVWAWLSRARPEAPESRRRRLVLEVGAAAAWVAAATLFWVGGHELALQREPGAERRSVFDALVLFEALFGTTVGLFAGCRVVAATRLSSWGQAGGMRAMAVVLLVLAFVFGGCWSTAMLPLLTFG